MKLLKLSLFLVMFSGVTFFSCKKNCDDKIAINPETEFADPVYQIADLKELEDPDVLEADETHTFRFRHERKHNLLRPCEIKQDNHKRGDEREKAGLPNILKQLDLNREQKQEIKSFLKAYCDCLSDHHRKTNHLNREMLRKANQHRQQLLEAYRNGRITKTELQQKLRTMHARLKSELRKDAGKRNHMEVMQKCQSGLFRNISGVLTEVQKTKFHRWVNSQK